MTPLPPAASTEVEHAILRCVAEQSEEWFPDAGGRQPLQLRRLSARPRAVLYAVYVGTGPAGPRVLAKVRRDWPDGVTRATGEARPRLTSEFLGAAEQTALEYRGLSSISAMISGAHPAFGAIRPLAHLAAENTILMEYVHAGTMRDLLVEGSRFSPRRRAVALARAAGPWRNAGAWLRLFQRSVPTGGLPGRQLRRDDVVAQFGAYDEFLRGRLGTRAVGSTARLGAQLAAEVLPTELPGAVGHGDYAPRNVFLSDTGRLTVFDPMPRWVVPRWEDLCRFVVGVRLHGLALHTHGWSDGARELDRRERLVIEGYGDDAALPSAQLRCLQLLITLDKWSAMVDTLPGGSLQRWHRPRAASLLLASGHLRRETQRLLDLAGAEDRRSGVTGGAVRPPAG